MNMRSATVLMLLAAIIAFSPGLSLAEDAMNATDATNVTNASNATSVIVPREPVSKYKQLSTFTAGTMQVLGKNIAAGYRDVIQTADRDVVFSREPGVTTPSVKVAITKVNSAGEKWVEISNQAVGSWDLTGWKLVSAGNETFTFPQSSLDMGKSVKVHEGNGASSATDLYTNATALLWTDNLISLQSAAGNTISSFDISTAPKETGWVNPLAKLIQY
jgi:hypothetical protein